MSSRRHVRQKVLRELVAAFDNDELDALVDELQAWLRDARELTDATTASENATLSGRES